MPRCHGPPRRSRPPAVPECRHRSTTSTSTRRWRSFATGCGTRPTRSRRRPPRASCRRTGCSGTCRACRPPRSASRCSLTSAASVSLLVGVSWSTVDGATSYDVEQSSTADFVGARLVHLRGDATTYDVLHSELDRGRFFRVRAVAREGFDRGPWSNVVGGALTRLGPRRAAQPVGVPGYCRTRARPPPCHARQRASRPARARPEHPRRRRRGARRRRVPLRTRGAHRLRAPVRAPHVPGQREPGEARPLPARAGLGRGLQRLDAPGLHGLLRGAARRGAGARAVPGGGPAPGPEADGGEPAQPGGRRQGGDPAQRPQPPLRRLPLDPPAPGPLRHVPERPQRLRRLHRARAGLPGRRRGVLRHLLRPGQRAGHGRRVPRGRRGPRARAGRGALRRHPGAAHPVPALVRRTAARLPSAAR